MKNQMLKLTLTIGLLTGCLSANAIPVLQLGPNVLNPSDPTNLVGGDDSGAYYVGDGDINTGADDDTWFLSLDGSSFSFNAYNRGDDPLAYLVFTVVPMVTVDVDYFDISVMGDSGALVSGETGIGAPPTVDPNSLASHGIFDSYFEVYELNFDMANTVKIGNTEPSVTGNDGTTDGRFETINVTINSTHDDVYGIHIDMFTADWNEPKTQKIVTNFAPFSHDAQVNLTAVPVPAAVWLFGSGLIGLVGIARRKS